MSLLKELMDALGLGVYEGKGKTKRTYVKTNGGKRNGTTIFSWDENGKTGGILGKKK